MMQKNDTNLFKKMIILKKNRFFLTLILSLFIHYLLNSYYTIFFLHILILYYKRSI